MDHQVPDTKWEAKLDALLRRKGVVFGFLFVLFALFNFSTLDNPPYWDEILGVHNQAIYLAESNFDFASLYRPEQVFHNGGSLIYPVGVMPLVYGVLYWCLPPVGVHVAGHLINLAAIALAGTLFLTLARKFCSLRQTVLWGLVALSEPIVTGRMAAQDQEAILIVAVMASLYCFFNGKERWALALAVSGCFIKLTGIVLVLAYAAYFVCEALTGERTARSRNWRTAFWTLLIFGGVLAVDRLTAFPQPPDPGGIFNLGFSLLVYQSKYFYPWVLPKFLIAAAAFLPLWRSAGRYLLLPIFIVGFVVAYLLHTSPQLPRYSAMLLLPLTLMLAYGVRSWNRKAVEIMALLFFAINIVNQNGLLLPKLPVLFAAEPSQLERSREYLKLIEIDRAMARELERSAPEPKLICTWPYAQQLTMPKLRYVREALPNIFVSGTVPRYAGAQAAPPAGSDDGYALLYAPNTFSPWIYPRFRSGAARSILYADEISPGVPGVLIFTQTGERISQ